MAYNARFKLTFSDVHGIDDWEAIIYKDGYSGSVTEVIGTEDPVQVNWQADEGKLSSMMPATAELNLIDENGNDFRELLDSDPYKFVLEITRNGTTYFKGLNSPDIYSEEFSALPREVTIRFVDGLGYLKNIEYKPAGGGDPKRETALDIIWGAKEEFSVFRDTPLLIKMSLFDNRTSTDSDSHPLDQHYFNEERFSKGTKQQLNSSGEIVPVERFINFYEALKGVIEAFNARMCICQHQDDYVMNIVGINEYGLNLTTDFQKVTGSIGSFTTTALLDKNIEAPINKNSRIGIGGPENDPANIILRDNDHNLEFYTAKPESKVDYEPKERNSSNILERGNFAFKDFERTQPQSQPGVYKLKDWTENNSAQQFWDYNEGGYIVKSSDSSAYMESPSRDYNASKLKFSLDFGAYFGPYTAGGYRNFITDYQRQQINDLILTFRIEITDANNNTDYVIYDNKNYTFKLTGVTSDLEIGVKRANDYKRKEEFTITPATTTGSIKVRIYGINNPKIKDSAGITFEKEVGAEVFKFGATVEEAEIFRARSDNSTVDNNALADPVKRDLMFSNNNPYLDAGAITILKNGKQTQADQWNNYQSTYKDGPLRHTKLIARELLRPYASFSRKLKGTITHGRAAPISLFTMEEYNSDIIGFLAYKYDHSLIENAVKVELAQSLHNLTLPDPTDSPDLVDLVDFPFYNFGGLDIIGSGNSDSVTITDGDIISGSGDQVIDLCEKAGDSSSGTVELPPLANASAITLIIKCTSCSDKTLTIVDSQGDTISEVSCGENVKLIPSNTLGWVVSVL